MHLVLESRGIGVFLFEKARVEVVGGLDSVSDGEEMRLYVVFIPAMISIG